MSSKSIVLDANIVIRAVLGERVRNLIIQHYKNIDFFVPDVCLSDAYRYIPQIFERRKVSCEPATTLFDSFLPAKAKKVGICQDLSFIQYFQ